MRVCRLLVEVVDDLAVRNGCLNIQIWDRDSILICEGDVSMAAVRMIEKLQLTKLTNTWAVRLARRCRRRFDPRSRSFSLSSTCLFSSLSSTSIFISSRCSFSCRSPLCPAPVRRGCLFRLFLSLLSSSSQPPIDRVSPIVALKLVTKPIFLNRLSRLSD